MNGIRIVSRLQETKRSRWVAGVFGILLVLGSGLIARYYIQRKWERDHVFVRVRPFKTSLGWGYEILAGDTIFIHQEFIPAIPGRHGFRTQEDAKKVGMKIIGKMKRGRVEAVTVGDLKELGIIDSIPAAAIPMVVRHPDTIERLRSLR